MFYFLLEIIHPFRAIIGLQLGASLFVELPLGVSGGEGVRDGLFKSYKLLLKLIRVSVQYLLAYILFNVIYVLIRLGLILRIRFLWWQISIFMRIGILDSAYRKIRSSKHLPVVRDEDGSFVFLFFLRLRLFFFLFKLISFKLSFISVLLFVVYVSFSDTGSGFVW